MDTAILFSELALAVGFLGFIARALVERIQELRLLSSQKEKLDA